MSKICAKIEMTDKNNDVLIKNNDIVIILNKTVMQLHKQIIQWTGDKKHIMYNLIHMYAATIVSAGWEMIH